MSVIQSIDCGVDYIIDQDTGCWIGTKPIAGGYSAARRRDGKSDYGHRVSYEMLVGKIPYGFVIDHLCRNRRCVNPAHLEPVTNAENCRRGAKTRLSSQQVERMRLEVFSGGKTKDIADKYKISESHLVSICTGKRWAAAGGPIAKKMPRKFRRGKVTQAIVNEMKMMRENGKRLREIAERFGLRMPYVCMILKGYFDE